MCGIEMVSEHKKNDKEHQLKHILSENLRMIPDKSDEVDKFGPELYIEADDDHLLHAQEHRAFMAGNTLKPQYKSKLENHIKKHDIAYKELERMGLKKNDNNFKEIEEKY